MLGLKVYMTGEVDWFGLAVALIGRMCERVMNEADAYVCVERRAGDPLRSLTMEVVVQDSNRQLYVDTTR